MSTSNQVKYNTFLLAHLAAILFHVATAITFIYALSLKKPYGFKNTVFFYFMAISFLIVSILSLVPIVQQPKGAVAIVN